MIEDFWNELNEGDIHTRDSQQIELKSEFLINSHLKQNVYKQEVYLFIPNQLQINTETYSKQQFYLDQTNLIRYKTPPMSFANLMDLNNAHSPLTRIQQILNQTQIDLFQNIAFDELKLFAAIFRNTARERVYHIIKNLEGTFESQKTAREIKHLCEEIPKITTQYRELQSQAHTLSGYPQLIRYFKYIDEFMSTTIDEFLIILLKQLRTLKKIDPHSDELINSLIREEIIYREEKTLTPKTCKGESFVNESILYRQGLLHRFVLECLLLKHFRFSPQEKHRNILGAFAAGIAMLVYMTLFVWKISTFVITSFPFVGLVVLFYILKDQIKEGFKTLYSKQAHRWFPDYSTEITNYKGFKIGRLTESFAFIDTQRLPEGFLKIRNHQFHEELQALHRHETIIQYKREMFLNTPPYSEDRRKEVTTIFRLNISRFLQKASNAFQGHLMLDPITLEISERLLPKIYHLNLIIHNTFLQEDLSQKEEIKTFRVIVDKNGIKRVEQMKTMSSHKN